MAASKYQNDREFTRIPIKLEVEVLVGSQSIKTDRTEDLSMKGVFMHCNETLPVGTECDVSLKLQGAEIPIHIDMKGTVGRSSSSGLGIQFTEIGLESYDHLQKLVMYNSHDTGVVEKEIKDHLGLKKRE